MTDPERSLEPDDRPDANREHHGDRDADEHGGRRIDVPPFPYIAIGKTTAAPAALTCT